MSQVTIMSKTKVIKNFESNSQRNGERLILPAQPWHGMSKTKVIKNFESNSQLGCAGDKIY